MLRIQIQHARVGRLTICTDLEAHNHHLPFAARYDNDNNNENDNNNDDDNDNNNDNDNNDNDNN